MRELLKNHSAIKDFVTTMAGPEGWCYETLRDNQFFDATNPSDASRKNLLIQLAIFLEPHEFTSILDSLAGIPISTEQNEQRLELLDTLGLLNAVCYSCDTFKNLNHLASTPIPYHEIRDHITQLLYSNLMNVSIDFNEYLTFLRKLQAATPDRTWTTQITQNFDDRRHDEDIKKLITSIKQERRAFAEKAHVISSSIVIVTVLLFFAAPIVYFNLTQSKEELENNTYLKNISPFFKALRFLIPLVMGASVILSFASNRNVSISNNSPSLYPYLIEATQELAVNDDHDKIIAALTEQQLLPLQVITDKKIGNPFLETLTSTTRFGCGRS